MSKTERWVWVAIVLVAVLATIAWQDLEGVAILIGAVTWRLLWIGAKWAVRFFRQGAR